MSDVRSPGFHDNPSNEMRGELHFVGNTRCPCDPVRAAAPWRAVTEHAPAVASKNADVVPLRRKNGAPIVWSPTIRAVRAIAEAIFSRNDQPPPADRLSFVEREFEDFLARCGTQGRWSLSAMIWLATWLAPLLSFRLAPLWTLPLTDRVRALSKLERRFGEPLLAVKAILCLIYYEHPESGRDVGYDGACLLLRTDTMARLDGSETAP